MPLIVASYTLILFAYLDKKLITVSLGKEVADKMKGKLLRTLYESEDYISGEALSREMGISRVSVWKHLHNLKEEGYIIDISPKGYRLISSPDLLLPYEFPDLEQKIRHFQEISSTMDVARKLAKEGKEGEVVVAETQTKGRGRLNRNWHSPKGGIYFTLVLKPKISPIYIQRLNLMASIAVAKVIRRLFSLKAEIKWPNDVLINGRKVCGILSEMEAETDIVNFVNLGVGINANNFIFQLESRATSLKEELGREVSRKEILSSVLKELEVQKGLLDKRDLIDEWKSLSATLNKEVKIVAPAEELRGQAIDIESNGTLILRSEDGSLRRAIVGDCIHID